MATYDHASVETLRDLPIDPSTKGFGGPLHTGPTSARSLAESAPHVDDGWLGSPRVLLRREALTHNIATMAAYCRDQGVALFPHGKTTMAPQVVAAQLDAGAGGVTVATVQQARVFHDFGVSPLVVANEVTDEAGALWLARVASAGTGASVLCYVDSADGVAWLDSVLRGEGTPDRLPVLVELGHVDGRTGARTAAQARSVAEAVARSDQLRLAGVAGYEGSIVHVTPEATVAAARDFCARLGDLTTDLLDAGLLADHPVVTAGGSAYFDAVVEVLGGEATWGLVLRSGCYVTHDHGLYRTVSPFERTPGGPTLRAALEVEAPVLSRPDRETVVVGVGRRDVSSDAGLPVVLSAARGGAPVDVGGVEPRRLFDQHLIVAVPPDSPLRLADRVRLGVSHPCTTFDKWGWVPVVDEHDRVVDVVRTLF